MDLNLFRGLCGKSIDDAALICAVKAAVGAVSGQKKTGEIKDALNTLRQITENRYVGAAVKDFARKRMDLLELRAETPKRVRWLKGLGSLQMTERTNIKAFIVATQLKKY